MPNFAGPIDSKYSFKLRLSMFHFTLKIFKKNKLKEENTHKLIFSVWSTKHGISYKQENHQLSNIQKRIRFKVLSLCLSTSYFNYINGNKNIVMRFSIFFLFTCSFVYNKQQQSHIAHKAEFDCHSELHTIFSHRCICADFVRCFCIGVWIFLEKKKKKESRTGEGENTIIRRLVQWKIYTATVPRL